MRRGFTLVELSIVLVIIGLLIGGILAAQSMIDTARSQKLIRMASQYIIAGRNFKTTYKYWPGDYPDSVFQCPGNSNGIIETGGGGCGQGSGAGEEGANYFYHLSATGMLPDKYVVTTNLSELTAEPINKRLPRGPDANTHFIIYNFYLPNFSGDPNLILATGVFLTSANVQLNSFYLFYSGDCAAISTYPNHYGCSSVSPAQALSIDKKIDDGMPNSGNFLGSKPQNMDGTNGIYNTCADTNPPSFNVYYYDIYYADKVYNVGMKEKTCIIGWRVDEDLGL